MSNVIQFPARALAAAQEVATRTGSFIEESDGTETNDEFITAEDAMEGLQTLWGAGAINTHGYSIGMHALLHIAGNTSKKTGFITLSFRELEHVRIMRDGHMVAPPVDFAGHQKEVLDGLVKLHYVAGVLNTLEKIFFSQSGHARNHFTSPHPMQKHRAVDHYTPLYFRLNKLPKAVHWRIIKDEVARVMNHCLELTLPG